MASPNLGTGGRSRPEMERGGFATTQWSMVVRAGRADGPAALAELCRVYWYPLFCFARRRCAQPQDAEDLTQGFFADLLARGIVAHADAARGRFRTFLLCAFGNYCAHERTRAGAIKRGGGCEIASFEAMEEAHARCSAELATRETAEQLFDRQWASQLIEQAMAVVRKEYTALGKAQLFNEVQEVLQSSGDGHGYRAIGDRLGSKPGAIKVAAYRLRLRLAREIRTQVARTVTAPADVEDEMQHLLAAVQR